MTNNPTEKALLARGFDSDQAGALRRAGHTICSLKQQSDAALAGMGLTTERIQSLREGRRPAIPPEELTSVLFANRWTCCVCRNPAMPIVVHHIDSWANSHNHSASNLAVLCLNHHSEAHTHRDLGLNLTPPRLANMKTAWETQVGNSDASAIQQGGVLETDVWFYFNHRRIYELALELGSDFASIPGFRAVHAVGFCDSDGVVTRAATPDSYMYEGPNGLILYRYVHSMLQEALRGAAVSNISDYLDRGTLRMCIVPGCIIYVQGAHTFTPHHPTPPATQLYRGQRRAHGVAVRFVFDLSEATSMSAWSVWLRGHISVGSLVVASRVIMYPFEAGRCTEQGT